MKWIAKEKTVPCVVGVISPVTGFSGTIVFTDISFVEFPTDPNCIVREIEFEEFEQYETEEFEEFIPYQDK